MGTRIPVLLGKGNAGFGNDIDLKIAFALCIHWKMVVASRISFSEITFSCKISLELQLINYAELLL